MSKKVKSPNAIEDEITKTRIKLAERDRNFTPEQREAHYHALMQFCREQGFKIAGQPST